MQELYDDKKGRRLKPAGMCAQLQEERQQVLAEWEAKLNSAAEATEAAQTAHAADKAAAEEAAAAAAQAAEGGCPDICHHSKDF